MLMTKHIRILNPTPSPSLREGVGDYIDVVVFMVII